MHFYFCEIFLFPLFFKGYLNKGDQFWENYKWLIVQHCMSEWIKYNERCKVIKVFKFWFLPEIVIMLLLFCVFPLLLLLPFTINRLLLYSTSCSINGYALLSAAVVWSVHRPAVMTGRLLLSNCSSTISWQIQFV